MIGKLGEEFYENVFSGLGEIWWVRGLDFGAADLAARLSRVGGMVII